MLIDSSVRCVLSMFSVREWRAGERPVLPVVEMIYVYHGFRCQNVQLLQRCLAMVDAELANSPYWNAEKAVSDFDGHESDKLGKSKHGLLLLLYASLAHHLSRPVTAARHLEFILDNKAELADDFYIVPFAQFELATIHLEQLQHQLQQSSSSSSSATTSDDNQLHPTDQQPDEPNTATPPTADQVRDQYRIAAGYREKYHFKNRLHLRIHLAVSELKRMVKGEGEGEGEGGGEGGGEDDTEGLDAMSEEDKRLVELAQKTEAEEGKER